MSPWPTVPAHFWSLLAACLGILLALWWMLLGSGRAARRRSLRTRIAALEQGGGAAPLTPAQDAAIQQSLWQELPPPQARLPAVDMPRRNALYARPWFLFVGDENANVGRLLTAAAGAQEEEAARHAAPATRPFWRWHRLPAMTAIDVHAGVLRPASHPHEHSLWYRALLELAERRKRLPLNGIVVCIAAATLLEAARERDDLARRMRALVHETADQLRIQLPVYLVVTGLERLEGFGALRAALPVEVQGQALGHRLHNGAAARVPAGLQFDGLSAELMRRVHALRMALLRAGTSPAQRQAIHAFVEQLGALQPGLRATAELLFGNGAGPRSPRWRGLYFTAAPPDDGGSVFAHDLFARFLPADQPLAHSRRPGASSDSDFASTRM
ncbi:MAG: hypothetical protein J7549_19185 [Variovorax sp.]|nr:hypothetical protein [Variovorax sp.]